MILIFDSMLHIFIDTNIFLNFYSFSNDHLSKLEELTKLTEKKEIKLYITRQVVDEFQRQREAKLKETIKHIENFVTNFASPEVCREMPEMSTIQKRLKIIGSLQKKLSTNLFKKIKNKSLPADKLITKIFKSNEIIEISDHIFNQAKRRVELGNPPGKNYSYGDAINWELLLEKVPQFHLGTRKEFYLITTDTDFTSKLDGNDISDFLKQEWKLKVKTKIIYYSSISGFLKDKFESSKITEAEVEEEKNIVNDQIVRIILNTDASTIKEKSEIIKNILINYPGKIPVCIKIGDRIIKTSYSSELSAGLINEMENVIGLGNVTSISYKVPF